MFCAICLNPSATGECVPNVNNKLNGMPWSMFSKTPLPLFPCSYKNFAAPGCLSTRGIRKYSASSFPYQKAACLSMKILDWAISEGKRGDGIPLHPYIVGFNGIGRKCQRSGSHQIIKGPSSGRFVRADRCQLAPYSYRCLDISDLLRIYFRYVRNCAISASRSSG